MRGMFLTKPGNILPEFVPDPEYKDEVKQVEALGVADRAAGVPRWQRQWKTPALSGAYARGYNKVDRK